ncbi:uncharacterized protein LOC117315561 [Pecten maximus]|uniref:uncharacterized protein LOC117315561 n=1 Tax=Pecten maximus TaxID=6579 RepID=UPI001457E968|nr:uncharacterized protein LOC117315561 [Pecten maximus]
MEFITQLWEERFLEDKEALYIVLETLSLVAKPTSDDPNVEVDYFIVPSMLQTANPEVIHHVLDDPDTVTTSTLCLKFNNPFIPQAVWDKMIASCIHRFQRLDEYDQGCFKSIYRGFACLTVDCLWNMIINCRDNAMKITMFRKDTDKSSTTGAGVNLLYILEFLLRHILESNHQSHLGFQFYLHSDFRFTSGDKMVKVDDLRQKLRLQSFSSNGNRWLDMDDLHVWFKDPDKKAEQTGTRQTNSANAVSDRNLSFKEIGRVSGYIGKSYQMFLVELNCRMETLEQGMEENRHLAFRSRITKVLIKLQKMKRDITVSSVADAMSLHGMDPSTIPTIFDCNRATVFKDGSLPEGWVQTRLSVK